MHLKVTGKDHHKPSIINAIATYKTKDEQSGKA